MAVAALLSIMLLYESMKKKKVSNGWEFNYSKGVDYFW